MTVRHACNGYLPKLSVRNVVREILKEARDFLREAPSGNFRFQRVLYHKLLPIICPDDIGATIVFRVKRFYPSQIEQLSDEHLENLYLHCRQLSLSRLLVRG